MKKASPLIMALCLGLALTLHLWRRYAPDDKRNREEKALGKVLPAAESFSPKEGEPPCYQGWRLDSRGRRQKAGLAFVTTDLAPQIKGYAGPLRILAGITPEGRLTGMEILDHCETPSYVAGINEPWFKEQFKNKYIGDKFILGEDLDGISRATVTVTAIARSLKKSGTLAARERLGLSVPWDEPSPWQRVNKFDIGMLSCLLALSLAALFIRQAALRYACLTFSLLLIGFYYPASLSMINISNIIMGRLPEFVPNLFWYTLVSFTLLTAIIWGRAYCGFLCPFGALSEFSQKICGQKISAPDKEETALKIKYILLWLLLMLTLILSNSAVTDYEPFATVFTLRGDILAWGFAGTTLLAGVFIPRFFCRYLCAVGAMLGLLSGFSPNKLKIKGECECCGTCRQICPTGAITAREEGWRINPRECIQCHQCRLRCPHGQIGR